MESLPLLLALLPVLLQLSFLLYLLLVAVVIAVIAMALSPFLEQTRGTRSSPIASPKNWCPIAVIADGWWEAPDHFWAKKCRQTKCRFNLPQLPVFVTEDPTLFWRFASVKRHRHLSSSPPSRMSLHSSGSPATSSRHFFVLVGCVGCFPYPQ